MKPRITVGLSETEEIEIWVNEAGRDLLVKELLALSTKNDHFHFNPEEVPLSSIPYRASDRLFEYGKVMFRPDDWDSKYYPHVMCDVSKNQPK